MLLEDAVGRVIELRLSGASEQIPVGKWNDLLTEFSWALVSSDRGTLRSARYCDAGDSTAAGWLIVSGVQGSTLTVDASLELAQTSGSKETDAIRVRYAGEYGYQEVDP